MWDEVRTGKKGAASHDLYLPVNFHSGVEKGESKPLDFEATFVMRLLWVRR